MPTNAARAYRSSLEEEPVALEEEPAQAPYVEEQRRREYVRYMAEATAPKRVVGEGVFHYLWVFIAGLFGYDPKRKGK